MRTPSRPFLPLALLLALALVLPACDYNKPDIDLILNVEGVDIETGPNAGNISVVAGQTTIENSRVTADIDVTEIRELHKLEIQPEFFAFTASAAAGKTQDSGTIRLLVSIGLPGGILITVPGTPIVVTIENNVVTAVSPSSLNFGSVSYDQTAIQGLLSQLTPDQRAQFGNMTVQEALDQIEAILANESGFTLSLVAQSEGVSGDLKLNEFSVDAQVLED